ncbi:hypothetical protein AVEN_9439-1 [Araneus ventricosus]|uniref:Uncharacterized protein n=1 Tax=Araneus ventricosus TaxID=182803 RepID=A0A4Y2FSY6_ARAVE|nr:hypothetical protein AVEN_9439-1 [Araneus ventricosus]
MGPLVQSLQLLNQLGGHEILPLYNRSCPTDSNATPQIAILVCINLALQACHGKSASLKQVIANDEVNTRRTCSKLVASNSLQTIEKTEYADEPWI